MPLNSQLLLDAFSRNRLSRRVKPYFECFNRMIYLNSFKPLLWSQCVLQDEKFEGVLSRLCPYFVFLSPLRAVFLQSPVQYFCSLSAFQQPPKPDLVVTSFCWTAGLSHWHPAMLQSRVMHFPAAWFESSCKPADTFNVQRAGTHYAVRRTKCVVYCRYCTCSD